MMKRLKVSGTKDSEIMIYPEKSDITFSSLFSFENQYDQSCIIKLEVDFRDMKNYSVKYYNSDELKGNIILFNPANKELNKIFDEELKNNDVTRHLKELVSQHNVKMFVLKPEEKVDTKLLIFSKFIRNNEFSLVVKAHCAFEDDHKEEYTSKTVIFA